MKNRSKWLLLLGYVFFNMQLISNKNNRKTPLIFCRLILFVDKVIYLVRPQNIEAATTKRGSKFLLPLAWSS